MAQPGHDESFALGSRIEGRAAVAAGRLHDRWRKGTLGRWLYLKQPPDLRLIVALNQDVVPLRRWLANLEPTETEGSYFQVYYYAVRKAQIISLEYIKEQLENEDQDYRKIDSLPPEEMPDIACPSRKGVILKPESN